MFTFIIAGINEKGGSIEAYGVTDIDTFRLNHGTTKSSLRSTLPLPYPGNVSENNEYQEPYQAMKFAPYYSYSPVIMEMQNSLSTLAGKHYIFKNICVYISLVFLRPYVLNLHIFVDPEYANLKYMDAEIIARYIYTHF